MTHTPLRMCVVCRSHKPAHEFIRISIVDGKPRVDTDKKTFARGAYICRNKDCINKAEKKHIIERHLKCDTDSTLYVEVNKANDKAT